MRKVLSFVLVLTLVLSSFSMAFAVNTTASAAGLTDIAGNANEDAIQVAYDLGIVNGNPDGTFLPAKTVNRAEFAAMITRALAVPDSALAGYSTTSFKDTAGYSWAVPYLAFCQSKGILLGDGNGNVMPGKTINMNEAITMALRAIGYTANSAELVGAWPSNYVTIAQNVGLYDDVAKAADVTKAMAAQIIYNSLTVQKVVVNADGDTNWTWNDYDDEDPANLLNTNLGCTEDPDAMIGVDYTYDNSTINISDMMGAFGTAYTNDDDDDNLIAFVPDSTALTGKVDGSKFKVGDTKYDFDAAADDFTTGVALANTLEDDAAPGTLTAPAISAWAVGVTDDDATVTINVDLSGKKIKAVYSVVGWLADDSDKAASDVQTDISEDSALLGFDFATDDNDAIKLNSFELNGVASLDKIEKDNVVYVYTDGDYIRKVDVGTAKVEGKVTETDEDTATIDGKDYDLAALAVVTIPEDIDVDSEGTFYLDVNGDIYDFDGSGTVDTYAVVKFFDPGNGADNARFKLYKSDDSTSTYTSSEEDVNDLDWTEDTAASIAAVKAPGALIGYSLDKEGQLEAIDNTQIVRTDVTFQSIKVLKYNLGAGTTTHAIDANCAVFTYTTDPAITSQYAIAKLNEVEKGTIATAGTPASIILNDDGDVVALFINDTAVKADDDDVYGVFNTRKSTVNSDDDSVYKFTGFIDGTAFTKLTDDRATEFDDLVVFGAYKITVDANDVITKVADLEDPYDPDTASGTVVADAVISSLNSDKTVITDTNNDKWTIADDAVVYKWDAGDEEYTVAKLSSLRKDYTVTLYDTKGEDADGVATLVVYMED